MYSKFRDAFLGRREWLRITKKYNIDFNVDYSCLVICMPDINEELNLEAIKNIDEYLKRKYFKRVLIISLSDIRKMVEKYVKQPYEIELLNEKKIYRLIQFYKLQKIGIFKIISLLEYRGLKNMIGLKGLSLKDIVFNSFFI